MEEPSSRHSRSSESKAATFDSTVVSCREDRILRVDPLVMMQQSIAQLQQENAKLRAELALKTVEHSRQLQEVNANKSEELASRLSQLSAQNLNLTDLLEVLQREQEALREVVRRKDDEIRRAQQQGEEQQLRILQLEQTKEQLLCMFKRFESRELYQSVRDVNCCQEMLCSNVQSLVDMELAAEGRLRNEYETENRRYLECVRQSRLVGEECAAMKDIDQEIDEFRKFVLMSTSKHLSGKTKLLESLAERMEDSTEAESVLECSTNIYKQRIARLKALIVRLLNSLKVVPDLKSELSRLSKHLAELGSTFKQQYQEMFQRAVESIQRKLHNSQPPFPAVPKPADRPPHPAKSKRKRAPTIQ